MLRGTQLVGFGHRPLEGGLQITALTGSWTATSKATNFNFTGTTGGPGYIVISINAAHSCTGFDDVQIDGVSATQLAFSTASGIISAIYGRVISATGAFDIDVDPNATSEGMIVRPYLVSGYASTTPSDTITANNTASGTIDVVEGGGIISNLTHWNGSANSQTITGVTEDYDQDTDTSRTTGAGGFITGLAVETGRSISYTGGTFDSMTAVAFDPA